MTAMHLFHSAILAFGHMEEELSTTCRAAADALEILSNLRPGFTRNVIPRENSTALSVSQPNNKDRQANNARNFSRTNARRRQPQAVLFKLSLRPAFPTVGSNRASRKSTSRRPARSKQNIKSTEGRPSKALVYKDLVLIPSPKIHKVLHIQSDFSLLS